MKIFLLIVAIFLIPSGYFICDLIYLQDINYFSVSHPNIPVEENPYHLKWWVLRMDLIAASVGLSFVSQSLPANPKHEFLLRFLLYVGMAVTVSDIIDRWIFNIRVFTLTDIIVVLFILIIGYRKYLKSPFKRVIKHK
jgi:hypothetical protein